MFSKLVGLLIFLLTLGAGGYYIMRTYFPNLVPPSKNVKIYLPLNSDTPSPLKIASGFRMNVILDLKGELPSNISLDDNGTIFVNVLNTGKILAFPFNQRREVFNEIRWAKDLYFSGSELYTIEGKKVFKYAYDKNTYSISNKETLADFSKNKDFKPLKLKYFENKIYVTNNKSVFSIIPSTGEVSSELGEKILLFLTADSGGNLYEIKDNKLFKHKTFAGVISETSNFVSGFTQDNKEILGVLSDVEVDNSENIYLADKKSGLIYIISK